MSLTNATKRKYTNQYNPTNLNNIVLEEETQRLAENTIRLLAPREYSVAEVRAIQVEFGETVGGIILASALLQKKANSKLGEGTWWVTEKSLQQATPWQVSAAKAKWFCHNDGSHATENTRRVIDLCCGLGGDSVHLSTYGGLLAVDYDTDMCMVATANLRNRLGDRYKQVQVCTADAGDIPVSANDLLHIDPDRRVGENRTTDPSRYSPDWSTVVRLVESSSGALIKVAPAAEFETTASSEWHRVWISLQGTVREQSILTGDVLQSFSNSSNVQIDPDHRSALIVDRDCAQYLFSAPVNATAPHADKPLALIIDPDAAIRAAGLTESFAGKFGLSMLGGPSGFLTADNYDDALGRFGSCEQVIWTGSCDDRKLRRELRARNLFPSRVKTRGVTQNPNQLEKKLRSCGEHPITLWIGRKGKGQFAAFTEPPDGSSDACS